MSDIQSGILANFAPAVRLPRAAGAPALPAHPPANQALVCLGELRAQLRAILSPDWARELSAEQELRWRTQARRVFRQEVAATVRFLRQLRPTPQSERRSGPASAEPGETSGLRPLARFRSLRLGLDLSNRPAGRLDQGYFSKIFQDVVKPDTVRLRTMADYQPLISEMKADLGHYRCLSQSDSTLKEQEPAPTGQGYLASIYADLVKPAIHFTANFRPEAYTALPRPDRLTNLPSLQPLTELPPRTGPVTNPASKPQTVPEGPKEVGTWASGVTNWVRGKLGVGGDIQPPPVAASPTSPVPDQSTMSGENKPQAEAPTNPGHSWWSGATSWASSMLGINGENKSQSVVADAPKDSWWSGITGWVSSKLGIDGESKPQSVVADAPKDPNNSWWSGITGWISEKLGISGESKTQPLIADAPKNPNNSWWSGITGWISEKLGISGESKTQPAAIAEAPKDANNSWWSGITGWISEKLGISGESKTQPVAIAEAPKDANNSWWSGVTGWISEKLGISGESKTQPVAIADSPKDLDNSWWSGITGWISEKLGISGESKTQPLAIAEAPKDPDNSWWSGVTGWISSKLALAGDTKPSPGASLDSVFGETLRFGFETLPQTDSSIERSESDHWTENTIASGQHTRPALPFGRVDNLSQTFYADRKQTEPSILETPQTEPLRAESSPLAASHRLVEEKFEPGAVEAQDVLPQPSRPQETAFRSSESLVSPLYEPEAWRERTSQAQAVEADEPSSPAEQSSVHLDQRSQGLALDSSVNAQRFDAGELIPQRLRLDLERDVEQSGTGIMAQTEHRELTAPEQQSLQQTIESGADGKVVEKEAWRPQDSASELEANLQTFAGSEPPLEDHQLIHKLVARAAEDSASADASWGLWGSDLSREPEPRQSAQPALAPEAATNLESGIQHTSDLLKFEPIPDQEAGPQPLREPDPGTQSLDFSSESAPKARIQPTEPTEDSEAAHQPLGPVHDRNPGLHSLEPNPESEGTGLTLGPGLGKTLVLQNPEFPPESTAVDPVLEPDLGHQPSLQNRESPPESAAMAPVPNLEPDLGNQPFLQNRESPPESAAAPQILEPDDWKDSNIQNSAPSLQSEAIPPSLEPENRHQPSLELDAVARNTEPNLRQDSNPQVSEPTPEAEAVAQSLEPELRRDRGLQNEEPFLEPETLTRILPGSISDPKPEAPTSPRLQSSEFAPEPEVSAQTAPDRDWAQFPEAPNNQNPTTLESTSGGESAQAAPLRQPLGTATQLALAENGPTLNLERDHEDRVTLPSEPRPPDQPAEAQPDAWQGLRSELHSPVRLTQNRLQETNIRSEIGLELEHKLESPTEEPGAARAELAEPLPVEPAGPADRLRALRREPLSEAGPLPEDWDPKQLWSAVADQIHLPPALSPLPAKSPAPVQSPQIVRPAPDTSGLIEELQLPDPGHLIQPRSPQTAPQRSVPEANPRSASASRFQFPAPAKVVAKKTETLKSQAAADKTGSKEPGQSPGEEVAENAAQGGGSAGGARLAGGGSSSATVSSQNAEAASETSEVAALHRANASTNLGGGSLLAFNQQSAATAQANQSAQAGAAQQREQDHEKAQSARKLEENKDSTKSSNQKQEFEQARKFHQQQQQRQRAGSAPQEPKGQQAQRYRQVQKNEEVKEQLAGTSEDHSQVACARCGFLLGGSADVNCPICSADHNDKIHQMLTQYRLSKDSWVSAVDTVVASPRAQLVLPEVSQAAVELRYIPKIPKFAQLLRTVKE